MKSVGVIFPVARSSTALPSSSGLSSAGFAGATVVVGLAVATTVVVVGRAIVAVVLVATFPPCVVPATFFVAATGVTAVFPAVVVVVAAFGAGATVFAVVTAVAFWVACFVGGALALDPEGVDTLDPCATAGVAMQAVATSAVRRIIRVRVLGKGVAI